MKHATLGFVLGVAQFVLALKAGWFGWLLYWSSLSWILAGLSYAGLGVQLFGKRADGSQAWWSVLMLPYQAAKWIVWRLHVDLFDPGCSNIGLGLWLGKRCQAAELPAGIELVVDLTAEFAEPHGVREGRNYIAVPALDASFPPMDEFQKVVKVVAEFSRPVYVHCALGHGRSALVVMAVLVARGSAETLEEANRQVKEVRPRVRLNSEQEAFLERWFQAQMGREPA